MFGVFRYQSDGIVDDETRRRMRLIVPHIRRAVLIGRLIDLKAADAASLADILDGLSAGMCLVDAGGASFMPMPPVTLILDAGDFLSTIGGGSSQAMRRLIRRFASCLQPPVAAMRNRNPGNCLAAEGAGRLMLCRACPAADIRCPRLAGSLIRNCGPVHLQGGNANPVSSGNHRPRLQSDPDRVARADGDRRSRRCPGGCGGPRRCRNTVKTHLGRLFVKTGTGRQADLVKVVAGLRHR